MKEPILGINFKQHKTPVTHIVWKKVRHFSYIFICVLQEIESHTGLKQLKVE